jgi:hypothetical protein
MATVSGIGGGDGGGGGGDGLPGIRPGGGLEGGLGGGQRMMERQILVGKVGLKWSCVVQMSWVSMVVGKCVCAERIVVDSLRGVVSV